MEKIGNMLKEKRIERGMSIEDVSEKTRLTTKHIKALEAGDISFFHEDLSYLRFFVKSYCDAVGVDFEDIKDDLRLSIDDYTMTLTRSEQLSHEEIERNIANSDKLTKVKTADVKVKKRRKPDLSFVSLIAVIGVVAVVLMFAFVVFLRSGSDTEKKENTTLPIAGENSNGKDTYPTDDEKEKEAEKEVKELEITKDGVTNYTLNNLKVGDTLTIETTVNGSRSGYSVTLNEKEVLNSKVYNMGETAKTEVKIEKDMKISVWVGCMVQTDIKLNGKVVKTDPSINPSTYPGSCPSSTLIFTVGELNESSK